MSGQNRTWLCCVAFLDVVSFTKHHMQNQMTIKAHLDKQIQALLADYSRDDYILLDRGDGAAVCFLIEPETALYFALNLRDAVRDGDACPVPYEIRTGINLGPVKIILDVNGDKTTLGEGINCAARVMDFAGPGQIYVSRSFFEVIGCLSQEYAELFSYRGKRADKHVREFELYEVAAARTSASAGTEAATTAVGKPALDSAALASREAALTDEIGPMAKVLVRRAARNADSLEELDRILAATSVRVAPDNNEVDQAPAALEPAYLQAAEQLLGEYLGPIAGLLVKNAAGRAADVAALRQLLADELADEQERQGFLSRLPGIS